MSEKQVDYQVTLRMTNDRILTGVCTHDAMLVTHKAFLTIPGLEAVPEVISITYKNGSIRDIPRALIEDIFFEPITTGLAEQL